MPQRTFSCPHCGLLLTIDDGRRRTNITYDPAEWRRLCQYPHLESPALCLLEGGAASGGGAGSTRNDNSKGNSTL